MALSGRRLLVLAALVPSVVFVVFGVAGPAHGHGGGASLEADAAEGPPGVVSVRVAVSYENDADPAEGAIVEVTPVSPAGESLPVVRLERQADPGSYAGSFATEEPGVWDLAVRSSFPPGRTEVAVEVGEGTGGSTAVNLVVAAVFGTVGGVAGLWVSRRRAARKRAADGDRA